MAVGVALAEWPLALASGIGTESDVALPPVAGPRRCSSTGQGRCRFSAPLLWRCVGVNHCAVDHVKAGLSLI